MSAWQEALWAADDVRKKHSLPARAAGTWWLDGRVGGRLGVRVTLPGGREVTGTPREIGDRVAGALADPKRKRHNPKCPASVDYEGDK